ncbi:MAG TPA: saccharopine dehydrogenase C-terminal domain-containing protein [Puia sp.]|nr:saccharopine dehydrogenase C-terminal domain-containing protein [Puia sp.]
MKKTVLFGAGKSSTCLIDYLIKESSLQGWQLTVADGNPGAAASRTGKAAHVYPVDLNVENAAQRRTLVQDADLVISLLPPSLHFLIAQDCIEFNKSLLTASYVDDRIGKLRGEIEKRKLLFLCEMGLDPGIDHMSAMQLIHQVKAAGGKIQAFRSHTGGLVAPESDDNPWHYKISWNPRNIVTAGSAGAVYKEDGHIRNIPYTELFDACPTVSISGLGQLAFYPNRDSLAYMPVYALENAATFIRTTLRHPEFCGHWKYIVKAGLTNDQQPIRVQGLNFKRWSAPIEPYLMKENRGLFEWLGFFDEAPVPANAKVSADILQFLLETKWVMKPEDKDMIVMLHEIDYELGNAIRSLKSSLIVKGENNVRTAMAKTVGLPLGIAAKLILLGKIHLTGLHIPILPEIYEPVLEELKMHGIVFVES